MQTKIYYAYMSSFFLAEWRVFLYTRVLSCTSAILVLAFQLIFVVGQLM
jgi:hypothetical protein